MKKIFCFFCIVFLALIASVQCFAIGTKYLPYDGYDINKYGESVDAPNVYKPDGYYVSKDLKITVPLSNPSDMQYTDNGLYILDSGNSRILLLDRNFTVVEIFGGFSDGAGNEITFPEAKGFYVTGRNSFVIADTGNLRILVVENGILVNIITRPESALLDTEAAFLVNKVLVNEDGDIYAIAESVNLGAFVFDKNGVFSHFFASNNVDISATVILNNILKRFLTKEQISGLVQATPVNINNFDIDKNGMIYTVTVGSGNTASPGTVRCLNYKGSNIISDNIVFGDAEEDGLIWSDSLVTELSDIDVDDREFLNLLDTGRRKVFQYTKKGKLVGVFGGAGSEKGMFDNPAAIESIGDNVIVLDSSLASITVFSPTEYGNLMRDGYNAMSNSDIENSMKIWQQVLTFNANSESAYYGIGMAYDSIGDYSNAMRYFKLANAKDEYSKAFEEYRSDFINKNGVLIIIIFVAIIICIKACTIIIKKRMTASAIGGYSKMENKFSFPIYTVFHPADGFEQFKWRKNIPSFFICGIIVLLLFIIKSLRFFYDGFAFNNNRSIDYNLTIMLISSVGIYISFIVANWSITSLMSGKGTFKEIAAVTAYSIIPYVFSDVIQLVLTNVLTLQESAIAVLVNVIGIVWSALLIFIGLMQIHGYSTMKNIAGFLLTLFAMAIIALLCVLLYTLICQTMNFFMIIISELKLRW